MRILRLRKGKGLPNITQQVSGRGRSGIWDLAPAFYMGVGGTIRGKGAGLQDGRQQWLSAWWDAQVRTQVQKGLSLG